MNETLAARALLELENASPPFLLEKVPGSAAYLWPLARWPISDALASAHLNVIAHEQVNSRTSRLYYLKRMAREALPNPRSVDRLRTPVPHLFFVSGVTRTSAKRGVGNWLSDEFAMALAESAVVVQEAAVDMLTPQRERPANPRTWSWYPAAARIRDAAKANTLSEENRAHVTQFLGKIYSSLGEALPPNLHDGITAKVIGWVERVHAADAEFTSLLNRTRPRRIYMEDASYGHYSNFIRIAHEREIEVAELQHGWIGASHAAYNFGQAWFDSPLTSSLPDQLLTFGSYWGEQLRFPGVVTPIGKPILEQAKRSAQPYSDRQHRLLIVSSVYERQKLIAAAKLLRKLLPTTWSVLLRPHPSERSDAETLFAEAIADGVSIDQEIDVNASIGSSRAVVGMVSTVLFEALPMHVHIGVIETGLAEFYADATVFPQRLDIEDSFSGFAARIVSTTPAQGEHVHSIWKPDPIQSFLAASA